MEIYRFRWQVECVFKRLKSGLHWDQLRAKDPQLAQVYLLGKLVGVLLLERLQAALWRLAPEAWTGLERPLSPGRLTHLLAETLQNRLRGEISLGQILAKWRQLLRYMCDEPRVRLQQLAHARHLLAQLGSI